MKTLKIIFIGLMLFGWTATSSATLLIDTVTFTSTSAIDAEDNSNDLVGYRWGTVNKLEYTGDWVKWTHDFSISPYDTLLDATLTLSLRDDKDYFFKKEIAIGYAEDGTWDVGAIGTGVHDYDVDVSYLADGMFTVTLASVVGDFYIDKSELAINHVPEPTIWLMFSAMALVLLRVKRS